MYIYIHIVNEVMVLHKCRHGFINECIHAMQQFMQKLTCKVQFLYYDIILYM